MVGTYYYFLVTRGTQRAKVPNPWLGLCCCHWNPFPSFCFCTTNSMLCFVVRVCKRHLDFLKGTLLVASNKKATKQTLFLQIEVLVPKELTIGLHFSMSNFNLIRVSFLLVYCLLNLESPLQLSNVMIQLGQASSHQKKIKTLHFQGIKLV